MTLKIQDILPLTPLQRGVLFHTLFAPGSPVYFEQLICRLDGEVDPAAMADALDRLAQRHPILRTAFVTKGQTEPRQVVFEESKVPLAVHDWRDAGEAEREQGLETLLDEDRRRGFQLNRPPLMRLTLLRYGPAEWRLIWSHHHILLDGWSLPILMRDYFALLSGAALPPPPRPFSDYVGWLGRQDAAAADAYWRAAVGDLEAPTPLGLDRPALPGALAGDDVGRIEARLAYDAGGDLAAAAERCRVSLGSLLLGAWAILLGRYSRQDDVAFGVTLSGRAIDLPGADGIVGLLINSLPLRLPLPADAALPQWLAEVQRRQLELQSLSHCDLAEIQRCSAVPRGQPLFETLVAIDNFPIGEALPSDGLGFSISGVRQDERTHYPLTLTLVPGDGALTLKLGFDRARIDEPAAAALADGYLELLRQIAARPDAALRELGLVRPAGPAAAPAVAWRDAPDTLASAFLAAADRFPERVAVSDGPLSLSYRQLLARAAAIAASLRRAGVAPGVRVGICLPRSAGQIAAMLGVTLAGGVYVPLDPDYPSERLAYQLADSQALTTLTDAECRQRLPDTAPCLLIERIADDGAAPLPPAGLKPDDGAYVIYTSGSTGQPKGVLVSQRNVLRLFASSERHFHFDENDVWSYFHSFAFDFSVWELWGALLHGGRSVVVPHAVSRDPAAFVALLGREGVTVLNQTPSAFKLAIDAEAAAPLPRPSALRWVVFGGEALRLADLEPWLRRHDDDAPRLANMYGITETTVHVTFRRIVAADLAAGGELSPIGEPLDDLSLELLDAFGHPVPPGAPGEIHVGGLGVSLGYLNRPELNAERFPGSGPARRYRSGDLARRNADGELLYCGRIDHQVKIRGFRIELGEVRAALLSHPAVRDVHVAAVGASDAARLIAYLRADEPAAVGAEAMRRHLAARLPAHMTPAVFIALADFPLTVNGKLDVKALPAPDGARSALETPYVEPANERQRLLAGIWQQVLGLPRVGVHDNYFSLGGDSIRSVRIAGLAKENGCPLTIQDIFRHGTIAALDAALDGGEAVAAPAASAPFSLISAADRARLPAGVEDAMPLARLQAGMLFHNEYDDGRNLYHDVFSHRLRARIDPARLREALAELGREHAPLRTGFALAGYSQPLQLVWRDAAPALEYEDLRGLDEQAREDAVAEQVRRLSERRFDTERPPLLRVGCLRLADDVWQLTLAVHHAILDGWSVATLSTRLFERLRGPAAPGRPLGHVWRGFIAAEQAALADPAQREYWRGQLAGPPAAAIPRWPQRIAPTGKARVGKREVRLPAENAAALVRLAADGGMPLKTALLALHIRVLACLCGRDEIVTGLVSNGRPADADGAEALGLFLNTLPLRVRLDGGSWRGLLKTTMEAEGASLPHRHFPMAEIRKLAGGELFETSFNYVDFHIYQGLAGDAGLEMLDTASEESVDIPLAVTFSVSQADGSIGLGFSYDRAAFPDPQIASIAGLYLAFADALARDPDACCLDMPAGVGAPEALSGASAGVDIVGVPQAVAAMARRRPDAVAVAGEGAPLRYAELDGLADSLARRLRALGAGADVVVALDLPRSPELVVAMLAALKAGAAYLPLDRGQPEARRREILQDASPALLICRGEPAFLPPGCAALDLDAQSPEPAGDLPDATVHGDALAYLLFTSGSSGRPKGVAVGRAALDNHMAWMNGRYPLDQDDVVLQKTPVGFDASVWEFWAPLMQGARLQLAADGGHRDPDYLVGAVREHGVTVLQLVPSLLSVLLATPGFADCRSLRRVFAGGEALPAAAVRRFHQTLDIPLINLYGPTEATIDASSAEYVRGAEPSPAVGLGRPIDGMAFRVLDARLNPVPAGVCGELYIAGPGLARGYHGRPALTAGRFVPDPLSTLPGSRLYRSGDIVRLLPDGVLEYLGRADGQIKLRGQRVEIGEIEARLAACPGVLQAAVAGYRDPSGAEKLAGYVRLEAGRETGDWRAALMDALRSRLPDYMLPAQLIALESWPLNASGKTDRAALPAPRADEAAARPPRREPETPRQKTLASIWRQVLQREDIGLDDNFFQLGGDSILGLQIVAQARQAGLTLAARDIFGHPTVAELAAHAGEAAPAAALPDIAAGRALPLTPAQRWFFDRLDTLPRPGHWNQALLLTVAAGMDAAALRRALQDLAGAHDAFRLRFARDDGGWFQRYAPAEALEDAGWLRCVDLSALPAAARAEAVETAAEAAQRGLDLENGPLLRAVHFDFGAGEAGRLLLVIHHLIVDGVSWRVLLQDLARLLAGGRPSAPRAGFGHWALARRDALPDAGERAYWLGQAELVAASARVPLSAEAEDGNRYGATDTVEAVLETGPTAALLRQGRPLRASAEEVLLAAALGALRDWLDADALALTMEGHGRDGGALDVSDTVGWFTAMYPLAVAGLADASPQRLLRLAKRALRAVPAGGAGYGALRHLAGDADARRLAALPEPQIAFNYLGQFDGSLPADGPLAPASEPVGAMEDPDGLRPRLIDIVALVNDGRLSMRWNYGRDALPRETVEALAQAMRDKLLALLQLDADAAADALMADDFPLATLDEDALPAALGRHGDIVDLWDPTPVQEGMLFHSRLEDEDGPAGVYIEQVVAELDGAVDAVLLEQAWGQVLARHDALRVSFAWEGLASPLQRVHAAPRLPFSVVELAGEAELERFLADDRAAGFDLGSPPLLRVALLTRGGAPWRMVWTHHHALLDGWSMAVIFEEMLALYSGLRAGRPAALPPAPSFGRFVKWLRGRRDPAAQESFWRGYFAGYAADADLGLIPAGKAPEPRHLTLTLAPELADALRRTARARRLTLNTLFQGALAVALSRIGRADDVVFGVTVAGRPDALPAIASTVGLFIATVPLRADCGAARPLDDFLHSLQDSQGRLSPFETSRLVDIHRWSGLPARQPLFDAVLIYENYPINAAVGGYAQELRVGAASAREQSNYPLTLYVKPGPDGIALDCAFDAARLEPARAEALLWALPRLLSQIAAGAARVGELSLAEPQAPAPFSPVSGDTALSMLADAARRHPDKIAVTAADGSLSYRELMARSRALARRLAARGVGPGSTVALALPPDARALTALLATLWSGAQYLPLDPALPPLRLAAILEDARPDLIIVDDGVDADWPADAARLTLPAPLPPAVDDEADAPLPGDALHPETPAYTLFTSGSTGRPKGVQVAHRSLANILRHFAAEPGLGPDDVLLSLTTWSFDIATLELLLPLACGAGLAIAPASVGADGVALAAEAARRGATVIQATPAGWRMLLEAGWRPAAGLRAWCGGEALPADLARALLDAGLTLWNVYGPTETTIWSAVHRVDGGELPPPAGHAIRHTTLWVADHQGQPLPPHLAGELQIGGDGLALGYLGQPAQTAARFRPDPLAGRPGARVYRSGDLACLRDDGGVRVLGRMDGQAKLNGFRLELEEVEARLRLLPGVRQAAAAIRRDRQGNARLVGYLLPDDSGAWRAGDEADPAALRRVRAELAAALPGYMVPSLFATLDALPLTPNRKLDRKALPDPAEAVAPAAGAAPQGPLEQAVCAIWEEVFERVGVAADDDFFDLGGHSLLATRIHVRVNKIFRLELPLRAVFHAQTPRALAALLAEREASPGVAAKIAAVYLKLRGMSDAEREALRRAAAQRTTNTETAE
ncbi:amino acid adenylation domain-containing protein [Chromobacterium sp. CV08]|uniref:amino acid adenylation domain-containing protein n=1 Tax=Chromobacterium sp. CV08 TaxID=3133274 RepID=UPI003DA9521D